MSSQIAPTGVFSGGKSNRALSAGLLNGLAQAQNLSAVPGFRDLVAYFLKIEEMARNVANKQAIQASLTDSPLLSAPLHLDIRIESYQNLSAADAGGSDPLTVQTQEDASGLASLVEVRTPQINGDGTVSYNVSVLKLAISFDSVQPRLDLAQALSLGQPLLAAVGGTSSGFENFMDQPAFGGSAGGLVWDFHTDNLQVAQDPESQQKMLKKLFDMANNVIEYLNQQEIIHAFDMSAEEKKRIEEMLKQQEIEAEKAAVLADIKKKRIAMEMVIKDLLKRLKIQDEVQNLSNAKSLHQRILHYLGSTEKLLSQAAVDPEQMDSLIQDFNHLSLQLKAAQAAQTSVPTTTAHH